MDPSTIDLLWRIQLGEEYYDKEYRYGSKSPEVANGYPSEPGPGVSWVTADRYDPVRVEQTREGLPRHTRIRPPGTRESPQELRENLEGTGEEPWEGGQRAPRNGPGGTARRHRIFGSPDDDDDDEDASFYTASSIASSILEDTQPQSVWDMAMDEVCERVRGTMARWKYERMRTNLDTLEWAVYFDEFLHDRRGQGATPDQDDFNAFADDVLEKLRPEGGGPASFDQLLEALGQAYAYCLAYYQHTGFELDKITIALGLVEWLRKGVLESEYICGLVRRTLGGE